MSVETTKGHVLGESLLSPDPKGRTLSDAAALDAQATTYDIGITSHLQHAVANQTSTIFTNPCNRDDKSGSELERSQLSPQTAGPVRDLADVSHRLKKLEKAVKSHLVGTRVTGDTSILSSSSGQQAGAGTVSHSIPGRLSERAHLRSCLLEIKGDIADLAAREVEGQLLQQRVARLEAAIGGLTMTGACGVNSGFTSLATSMTGAAGPAARAHGQGIDQLHQALRTSPDVSVLVDRLSGMEGLMKELTQAQVANTAVLQQIGGRLGTSPVPQFTDELLAPYSRPCPANRPHSVYYTPPRPPSCPLTGGVLNNQFETLSPPYPQTRHRAPSPDPCFHPFLVSGGTAAVSQVTSHTSTASVHPGQGIQRPTKSHAAVQQDQGHLPFVFSESQSCPHLQDHSQQQHPQQQQLQHKWQVEVVLASHDADLAAIKESVSRLKKDYAESAAAAAVTADKLADLVAHVASLEQQRTATVLPVVTLTSTAAVESDQESPSPSIVGSVSLNQADPAALMVATESLSAGLAQSNSRLDKVENGVAQQHQSIQALSQQCDLLQEQSLQVCGTLQASSAHVPKPMVCTAEGAGPDVPATEQLSDQLQQLLNSPGLQNLISAMIELELQRRLPEALAQYVAADAHTMPLCNQSSSSMHDQHAVVPPVSANKEGQSPDITSPDALGQPASVNLQAVEKLQQADAQHGCASNRSTAMAKADDKICTTTLEQAEGSLDTQAEESRTDIQGALSTEASTEALNCQLEALQADISCREMQAMQLTIEVLSKQVAALQQNITAQAAILEHQRVSAAAAFTALAPLELQVRNVEGQMASLAKEKLSTQQTAELESKLDALQAEIQQMSGQLAEVNESAAQESDLDDVKAELASLQLQIQDFVVREHGAAVVASTSDQEKLADAGVGLQNAHPDAPAAVEASDSCNPLQQTLTTMQQEFVELQEDLEAKLTRVAANTDHLNSAVAEQGTAGVQQSAQIKELASKLAVLGDVVADRAKIFEEMVTKVENLSVTLTCQQESMDQQLHMQADNISELHHQLNTITSAQHSTESKQISLQEELTAILQQTAHQLQEGFTLQLEDVQDRISAAARKLIQHEAAIEACAKADALTAVVTTLQQLPGTVEGVVCEQQVLEQAQRVAEGQLLTAQEELQKFVMQLTSLQSLANDLQATSNEKQSGVDEELELLRDELMAIQQQKLSMQQVQQQQCMAMQQLDKLVQATRSELLDTITRDSQQLAQGLDELQAAVSEQDQLWIKLQAVFDVNKARAPRATVLFKTRVSQSLTVSPQPSATVCLHEQLATNLEGLEISSTVADSSATASVTSQVQLDSSDISAEPLAPDESIPGPGSAVLEPAAPAVTTAASVTIKGTDSTQVLALADGADNVTAVDDQLTTSEGNFMHTVFAASVPLPNELEALQEGLRRGQDNLATLAAQQAQLQQHFERFTCDIPTSIEKLKADVSGLQEQHAKGRIRAIEQSVAGYGTADAQAACMEDEEVVPISIVLVLQQQLAKVTIQIEELANTVKQQTATSPAGTNQLNLSMPDSADLDDKQDSVREQQPTRSDISEVPEQQQMKHHSIELLAAAHQQQQHLVAELSSEVIAEQEAVLVKPSNLVLPDLNISASSASAPPVGVLHAPLSLVVQLQSELADLKDSQISKEQFSAVVRMVRELKEKVTSLPKFSFKAIDAADAISIQQDAVHAVLQQHTEQLATLEDSMHSVMRRLEAAEDLQQQQTTMSQGEDSPNTQQDVQATAQQQQSQCSAATASGLAQAHQRVGELSAAQESLLADLCKLQSFANDLAAKLDSAMPGAVMVVPRSPSQEALGADFSGMMAGLANFKRHMDEQLQLVMGLEERLQAQESAVASLLATATVADDTNTTHHVQDSHAISTNNSADALVDDNTADSVKVESISATCNDMSNAVQALTRQLKELSVRLDAHDIKLSTLEHEHQSQVPGDTNTPSVMFSSASFKRSISRISSITESDAMELAAAAVGEAAEAAVEPISLVHSFLKELKIRIERLEASAYKPGDMQTALPSKPASGRVTRVRQAAVHKPSNGSLTLAELQDLVIELQDVVGGIEEASTSQAAVLKAIQGDVAAAAAAAAAAITAAECTPPHHVAADSTMSPVCGAAESSEADAAAAAAGEAASAALLKVHALEQSLSGVNEKCEQFQDQLDKIKISLAGQIPTSEVSGLQPNLQAVRQDVENSIRAPSTDRETEVKLAALQAQLQNCFSRLCTLEAASRTVATPDQMTEHSAQAQDLTGDTQQLLLQSQLLQQVAEVSDADMRPTLDRMDSPITALTVDMDAQQLRLELQHIKQQVQLLQIDVGTLTAAQQVHVQNAQADDDEVSASTCPIPCNSSCAAADAKANKAIKTLEVELARLQDQVAWVVTESAAATAKAVACAVGELQHQLDGLQQQMKQHREPGAVCTPVVEDSTASKPQPCRAVQPSDSFSRLAARSCTADGSEQQSLQNETLHDCTAAEHALQQQSPHAVASADFAEGWWVEQADGAAAAHEPASMLETSACQQTSTAYGQGTQQQAADVQESLLSDASESGKKSTLSNRMMDSSSNVMAADAHAPSAQGLSFQELLVKELESMSPMHQGALLRKLATVVSAHAARLLATYHTDPELAKQITQVQQQISLLGPLALCSIPATVGSGSPVDSSRSFERSSSSSRAQLPSNTSTAGLAAGSNISPNSAEVLLGILDQVASLRAVGSATHPAVNKALQNHEAQLMQLSSAVYQLQQSVCYCPPAVQTPGAETPVVTPGCPVAASQEVAASTACAAYVAEQLPPGSDPPVSAGSCECASSAEHKSCSECSRRLSALEYQLSNGLKSLSGLQDRLAPIQEVADATQSMMRELQVANGLILQRLEVLEKLAHSAVTADSEADPSQAGALTMASLLHKLQSDSVLMSRRVSAAEAKLASVTECLTLTRRVAAHLADTDARCAQLASRVSGVAGALPMLVDRVAGMEGCQSRALVAARQGLDLLADQLVALGALSAHNSTTRNPLAALGPNHSAISALEGKLEAVRTAMTASVRFMMEKLAAESASMGNMSVTPSFSQAELGAGVVASQVAASEAVNAAVASHRDALNRLEAQIADVRADLHLANRCTATSPSG